MTQRMRATCPKCIDARSLEGMKHCHGECDLVKPLEAFHDDKSSKDGKLTECRECRNKKSKTYGAQKRAEDPNYFYDYHKNWIAVNGRERYSEYEANRATDPERKEYVANYLIFYREENPQKFVEYGMVRRARKSGASVCEVVERLVVADTYDWICQECFGPIDPAATHKLDDGKLNPWYLHIDHRIPLSKGGDHSYANCQPMHATCNWHKSARLDLE